MIGAIENFSDNVSQSFRRLPLHQPAEINNETGKVLDREMNFLSNSHFSVASFSHYLEGTKRSVSASNRNVSFSYHQTESLSLVLPLSPHCELLARL